MGLLLLLLLTCAFPLASSDTNDEACLTHLSQTLRDQLNNLRNWTKSTFTNPCSNFTSYLPDATCNNGRIPTFLGNRSKTLPKFNATSFEGNKDLYGYHLPLMKSNGLSVLAIVGIGLGSKLASLVVSFTGVCIWLKITEEKMAAEEGKVSQLIPDY
ncbi:receptor like protein 44 [Hibiscus trionum]|uniref:Receptor like protein 44 n=1 Tax=Hibiscus trionum TaxID=183268 RepID=A0A9W7J130_HIBTR|nr:receptor like protein 44 [Hibiscus trionum]